MSAYMKPLYIFFAAQFVDVRLTALECLVDYVKVEGSENDLNHLLNIVETDPVPYVRHRLLKLLVDNPPFERNRGHRNDTPELVDRLWRLMK
jgi:transcription initiation factor TFIID subunit 2